MPSYKIFTVLWITTFNLHIRITKPYKLYLIALFGQYSKFLVLSRGALWFIVPGELFASVINRHIVSRETSRLPCLTCSSRQIRFVRTLRRSKCIVHRFPGAGKSPAAFYFPYGHYSPLPPEPIFSMRSRFTSARSMAMSS